MKSNRLTIALLVLVCWRGWAGAAGPVQLLDVSVECTGGDSIGNRMCYAVKEKLRASHGFHLVATRQVGAFTVHLVSLDTGTEQAGDLNNQSAIAEVLNYRESAKPNYDVFVNERILIAGRLRVDAMADDIVADLDQDTEFMRGVPSSN